MNLHFYMPFPPTINTYYRAVKGRNILSEKGRKYQVKAVSHINMQMRFKGISGCVFEGDVKLKLIISYPDKRKRDVDNYLKAVFDAITKAGIWKDDSQVKGLELEVGGSFRGGNVEVEIISKEE